MQSHEVLREVLKQTSAKQIAADMAPSLSLIYKWAEPPEDDSGSGASSAMHNMGASMVRKRAAALSRFESMAVCGVAVRF